MSQPNIFIAKLAQPLQAGGSETEIFLDRLQTLTGEPVTTSDFSLFARGILTINPDGDGKRSFPEYLSFTGVDEDDLSLTGAIRGLSAKSNSVIEANKRYHPAGTRVAITFGTHNISDLIDYIDNEIGALSLGSNQVVTGTAGETVSAGQALYLKDDGKWWLSRADEIDTIYEVQLGIAQGAGVADGLITNGVLRLGTDANQSGLTVGDTLYVSDTPGAISDTAGTNERILGVARSTDNFYFDPSYEPNGRLKAAQSGGGDFGTPSASNKFVTEEYQKSAVTAPQVITFTSSGTWTKDAGLKYIVVEGVGGGSGGGGGDQGGTGGGGGGAGGYCRKLILASALGATETVTIGAGGAGASDNQETTVTGGNTTFGSFFTAGGAGLTPNRISGAPGGTATGGDINISGNPGISANGGSSERGGNGGSSYFGGGGKGSDGNSVNQTAGATNSGSGGGGGGDSDGSAGADGIVIVTEYYS